MALRRIKADSNLRKFSDFCRKRYGRNLIAIGIYGSYAWKYFDKEKSDYDVFLIFKQEMKDEGKSLMNKFRKITVQYFCSKKGLSDLIKEGHWSLYITLLTSARMLYYSKDYELFINKLRKIDFIKNLKNLDRIKWKVKFNRKVMLESRGYSGAKYALPALRSRLQLLAYIEHKRLIWDLLKVIKVNKDFLTQKEEKYLIELDNSVRKRKNAFPDKKMAINLSDKINKKIISLIR